MLMMTVGDTEQSALSIYDTPAMAFNLSDMTKTSTGTTEASARGQDSVVCLCVYVCAIDLELLGVSARQYKE